MKKRYGFFRFAIYTFFATMLFSCTGIDLGNLDDPSIYIDQSLVTPIGYAKQDAKQFLTKLNISNLNFDTREIMVEWNNTRLDTIKVDPFNINRISKYDKKILLPAATYQSNQEYPLQPILETFDVGVKKENNVDVRVDSLKIKHTTLDIKLTSSSTSLNIEDFTIQFTFPSADTIRFHNPKDKVLQPITLSEWNTSTLITTDAYDLLLNGKERISYKINIKYKPKFDNSTTGKDSIRLNIAFKDIESDVAYGKFDFNYKSHKFVDIPFNIDSLIPDKDLRSIEFADPRFVVTATNFAGMNFNVTLDSAMVYRDGVQGSEKKAYFVDGTKKSRSTTIAINGPTVYKDSIISVLPQFDAENGGTDSFLNDKPFPDKINYAFTIATNNTNRVKNDFVSPDSKITFNTKVQIPLYIKKGFSQEYSDTIVVTDLQKTLNKVDSAYLVLDVNNAFPLIGKFHMTFYKYTGDTVPAMGGIMNTINSGIAGRITDYYIINPPQIDSNGLVMMPSPLPKNYYTQRICIKLSKAEIEQLRDVAAITYKVLVANEDANGKEQLAHITTDCFFGVKIGVYVKANTTINQK